MDFLKHLALPQSEQQIVVLHMVLNIVSIIFLPYISILWGSSLLSIFYNREGKKKSNIQYLQFAKDLAETFIVGKGVLFLFGVVPFLSLVFSYAQIFQETSVISISILTFAFFLFVISAALLYSYYYTLKLGGLLNAVSSLPLKKQSNNDSTIEDVKEYEQHTVRTNDTTGMYGITLLTISLFLWIVSVTLMNTPQQWESVTSFLSLIFSLHGILRFVEFIAFAFVTTSAAILFYFFAWQGGKREISDEYSGFVKKFSLSFGIIATLIAPLFLFFDVALVSSLSVSNSFYFYAVIVLIALLLIIHFFYALSKNFSLKTTRNAFYFTCVMLLFFVLKEQTSFATSTQKQSSFLAAQYTKHHEELLASMGVSLTVLTGEDIFVGKCSACHNFAKKEAGKIGPLYKDVLPKYENDKQKLVSFILNPQKVDPAFPPMPNQGLKPKEADSIAAYIMKMYKQ